MAEELSPLLTQKEAAAILRCSTVTLWRMRRDGELLPRMIRGRVMYLRSDLQQFLESSV